MPKSSELFPLSKTPTTTPTQTTDTTPPKIVLLDNPTSKMSGGKLSISIRTLLIDEITSVVQVSNLDKPTPSWDGVAPSSVSTAGEVPVKVRLRISEGADVPAISWVGTSVESVSTLGESSVKIKVRIV